MIKLPTGSNVPKAAEVVSVAEVIVNVKAQYIPPSRPIKTAHVTRAAAGELTNRESQIKALLLMAVKPVEIAQQLGITIYTVKFHKTNIYKHANVNSIAQLLTKELQHA